MSRYLAITLVLIFTALALAARAQEAYFITYSHHMEDTGDLEVASKAVAGTPKRGNTFLANALEFEYGIKPQWTAEVYLDGQTTIGESTAFTGFRIENRIRPLTTEHRVNPVLYFELEDINSADKTLLEIVGHDRRQDFLFRPVRIEREREAELRLILSSNFKGWHASQNTIFEKNLAGGPWEFGYAVGITRRLGTSSGKQCTTCRKHFDLGAEAYGGLGDTQVLGLSRTSHYLAPVLKWQVLNNVTLRMSPGFGLNDNSQAVLLRFGVSYEVEDLISKLKSHQSAK